LIVKPATKTRSGPPILSSHRVERLGQRHALEGVTGLFAEMPEKYPVSGGAVLAGSTRGDVKESWPRLLALTSFSLVELPGIEPGALPVLLPSELPVRYVPFRFNPARYLRFVLGS
jgi:hypothetical protein